MQNPIQTSITKVMNEYLIAKKEPLKDHSLAKFIRSDIPEIFNNLSLIDNSKFFS